MGWETREEDQGGGGGEISRSQQEETQKLHVTLDEEEERREDDLLEKLKGGENGGFDAALELAGSWGWWQKRVFVTAHFSQIFCSIHAVSAAFLSYTPDHWCRVEGLEEALTEGSDGGAEGTGTLPPPYSTLDLRNISIPWNARDGYAKCEYYDHNYTTLLNNDDHYFDNGTSAATCDSWVFNQSVFQSTLVTEFSLVCGRRWMMATVQASFMSGLLIGSIVMGQLSDRFGRRVVNVWCALGLCVLGICASFVSTYFQFLALRFIIAFLCSGLMVVGFVLVMEVVKPEARTLTGMLYAGFFGLGITILPGIAYFLRDWRHLELSIGVSSAVLVAYFWILPESPRWLASQHRGQEAVRILKDIARTNGKTLPPDHILLQLVSRAYHKKPSEDEEASEGKVKKGRWYSGLTGYLKGQVILVRTRVMRRRALICFYMWFAAASIYYGLIFSGANIKADPFLMIFFSGLVELPSCVVFIHPLNKYGRRPIMCGLFMACAACLLSILAVPEDQIYVNFFLVNLGKFFTTAVFQLQYLYVVELFPTSARNMALGTCSMIARIGCVITPYIVTLLGDVHYTLPSTLFGVLSMLAGLLTLLLPETNHTLLPSTTEEVEAMGR